MRTLLLCAVTLSLALGVACDPGLSEPETEDHIGIYSLLSADGRAVPTVVSDQPTQRVELLSGRVGFGLNRAAMNEYTYRITRASGPQTQTFGEEGTYTVAGTTISVIWPGGRQEQYTLSGDSVTVFDGTLTLVFRK